MKKNYRQILFGMCMLFTGYVVNAQTYFINQDFNSLSSGTTAPTGWTSVMLTGDASFDFWRFGEPNVYHVTGNPVPRNASSPISGKFAMFDSDGVSSSGGAENIALETPSLNTSGYSKVILKFDQDFGGVYNSSDSIIVEVHNGTAWNIAYVYTSTAIANSQEIDISAHAANKTSTKVRFRFVGNWSWWWIVDNVQIFAPAVPDASFTVNNSTQCLSGNNFVFTNTSSIAAGTMTYNWNFGDATTSTAANPSKSYAAAGTYEVTMIATSNYGLTDTIKQNVVLDPAASVTIAGTPNTAICPGASITFTATPTNGGTTPAYQWKKNGLSVGTNSSGYVATAPAAGDIITCEMTSSINCATPSPATSNSFTVTHLTAVTPSVSVSANPGTNTCPGTNVTFTATPANGGSTPSYQWKVNGVNAGANSTTYSSSSLSNGDIVTVTMTPSVCASPATATDGDTMTILPNSSPTINISATPGNVTCSSTPVAFTASVTNGGASPAYQWKRNGVNVGTNSATYTPGTTLNHNDTIICVVTSSSTCASPANAVSNAVIMDITPTLKPTVTVIYNNGPSICHGTQVVFAANYYAGGATPSFQWKIDGVNVGTNSPFYVDNGLMTAGSHAVTCTMTSSYVCPQTPTGNGTANFTVNPMITPTVDISAPAAANGNVCEGSSVLFTANITHGGSSPQYQWIKNGNVVGTGSTYNADTTLATGDSISCILLSNANCATALTDTSDMLPITKWPNVTSSIAINSDFGTNACENIPVTYTAAITNPGLAPSFLWKKDSVVVGTDSMYIDSAKTGGVVYCEMTTSLPCATPVTPVSNAINMTINPVITATMDMLIYPDSVACEGSPFSFFTMSSNAGNSPVIKWYKNGTEISGANLAYYISTNLADGDVISCELISSMICAFPVMSNAVGVQVNPSKVPTVDISGVPGVGGITFYSNLVNGGSAPKYQWRKNNVDIPNGNAASFTATDLKPKDVVYLYVESNEDCASPKEVISNTLLVSDVTSIKETSSAFSDLTLFPNPNEGRFSIKGNIIEPGINEAIVEIMNVMGQVVYKDVVRTTSGNLHVQIDLAGKATAGMYMVRLQAGNQSESMRFILK